MLPLLRIGTLAAALLLTACAADEDASVNEEASVAAASSTAAPTPTTPPTTAATTAPSSTTTPVAAADGCAHVTAATIEAGASGFTVSATVRSADTGWEKYADAWEVRTETGAVLGERVLAHPHETEQPFTRSLTGVQIPEEISQVVVVARDSVLGFCGDEATAEVPHP